jgi:hypothetical protein
MGIKEQYEILEGYFELNEDKLIEMAMYHKKELFITCMMLSLDFQTEIEEYVQVN